MWALDDLSGKEFGIWKVLEFDHLEWNGTNHKHAMSYYKCECKKCGKIVLKPRSNLMQHPCKRHFGCVV